MCQLIHSVRYELERSDLEPYLDDTLVEKIHGEIRLIPEVFHEKLELFLLFIGLVRGSYYLINFVYSENECETKFEIKGIDSKEELSLEKIIFADVKVGDNRLIGKFKLNVF